MPVATCCQEPGTYVLRRILLRDRGTSQSNGKRSGHRGGVQKILGYFLKDKYLFQLVNGCLLVLSCDVIRLWSGVIVFPKSRGDLMNVLRFIKVER